MLTFLLTLAACADPDCSGTATLVVTLTSTESALADSEISVVSRSCSGETGEADPAAVGDTVEFEAPAGEIELTASGSWRNDAVSDTGGVGGSCTGTQSITAEDGERVEATMELDCASDWAE